MLIQIDAVVRALAVLGNITEERVVEQLEACGDPWGTVITFLNCRELRVELDAQAKMENPHRRVEYGDTATAIRVILQAA